MKQFRIFAILITLASLSGCQTALTRSGSSSLPDAPAGFSWIRNDIGSFLKPDDWHVKKESKGNTHALFISREDISKTGRYDVGLSVNQVNAWSTDHSDKPSEYAKAFAAKLASTREVLKQAVITGKFPDMYVVRIRGRSHGVSTIVHYIAIGMDETDRLYLISFEAPESQWNMAMQEGGPMLNYFVLGN